MKTLHIHIGTAKTATTAIQAFCEENRGVLRRKGYIYPLFGFRYPGKAKRHNGSFLGMTLRKPDGKRDRAAEQKNYKTAMRTIRRMFYFYENIVLSDEGIWRAMDKERQDLWEILAQEAKKGKFALHVIVYLRRQDEYFLSSWNQKVKKRGAQETAREYLETADLSRGDYFGKLERMASVIGREQITVRRFEDGRFEGGSIYADFLFALGLSMTEEYHISQEVRNLRLSGNAVEIKRILNSIPQMQDTSMQLFLVEALWECAKFSGETHGVGIFTKEEAQAFLAAYRDGNRKVAEVYLHEPGGELFLLEPPDRPVWQRDNPYWMEDVIRFVGAAIVTLHGQCH